MWKRLTTLIAIIWLSCGLTNKAFAAIAATTVWEVRTTGSATNGGGYDSVLGTAGSGVDYSNQQDPQESYTTLTAAQSSTTVTCSGADTFAAGIVGNIIYIASGTNFTAGWYQVTARTSSTSITVDTAPATTGAGSSGVGNMGGAVDHPNTISTKVVAGNTIYIAGGTYVKVGANTYVLNLTISGTNGSAIINWIGYISGTARTEATGDDRARFDGDSDTDGAGDTKNILTVAANVIGNVVYNVVLTRSSGTVLYRSATTLQGFVLWNSKLSDSVSGLDGDDMILWNCEISNMSSKGDATWGTTAVKAYYYCYIHDNSAGGLYPIGDAAGVSCYSCIVESNGSHGVASRDQLLFYSSISYNNTGYLSDGYNFYSSRGSGLGCLPVWNSMFVGNGRYGLSSQSGQYHSVSDYNLYYGNGTSDLNNAVAGAHDITTDPLFVDPTNGDFTVQLGSGAIANGFPNNWLWRPGAGASFSGTVATSSATSPYDDVDWTNPKEIKASDNVYATATINNNYTYTGVCTNFGFSIPTDATIKGVVVKIEAKAATAARVQIPYVKLIKTGSASGDNKGTTTKLTIGDVIYIFGDTTTIWGNTLTPSDINASNFGVEFSCQETSSNNTVTKIDNITITVYYDLTRNYKTNIGVDQDDNTATTGGGGQGGRNARIGAGIGG